ncbi:hypothetical protein [Devosia sp. A369]
MATKPTKLSVSLPALLATISQESAVGKTTFMTALADVLTLSAHRFTVYQADDKPRLQQMLGARVIDLKPDAELLLSQPSLLRTAYTPLYTACAQAKAAGSSVLLDAGAREVENLANFFADIELEDDLGVWQLPMVVFVPVQADPESIQAAIMTWHQLRRAVPSARLILVENLHDRGAIERMSATSTTRRVFEAELLPLLGSAPRLVMPAILTEFWKPFEETGTRFLKIMAMPAEEGAVQFGMEVGDFKLARGHVTRFFKHMSQEISGVLALSGKVADRG